MKRMTAMQSRLIAAVAMLATPVHAQPAAEPLVFDHYGDWVVDYADTHCRLLRGLAAGDEKVIAQFLAYEPGAEFELRLIGDAIEMDKAKPVKLAIGNQRSASDVEPTLGVVGNDRTPMIFLGSKRLFLQRETDAIIDTGDLSVEKMDQIASLSITYPDGRRFLFNTGPLGQPMIALRACVDDLYRGWGIDPEGLDRVATPPQPKNRPITWVTTQDYPPDMLGEGKSANVEYLLVIDERGKIESCRVLSVTDHRSFGKLVCQLVRRRARFSPAMNADGKPVRSIYQQSVHFRM